MNAAQKADARTLAIIARLGYLTIWNGVPGSTAVTVASLRRLVERGDLRAETFQDKEGREWVWLQRPDRFKLPSWATVRGKVWTGKD